MIRVDPRSAGLAVLCAAACVGVGRLLPSSPELEAAVAPNDRDGDLLPDDLEWSLLCDPTKADTDDDGVDDFLASVLQQRPVLLRTALDDSQAEDDSGGMDGMTETGSSIDVQDHEARVVLSSRPDPDGQRAIWVHFLFRFAHDQIAIQFVDPWLCFGQTMLPLMTCLGTTGSEFVMRRDPQNGTYARYSARLGLESEFMILAPFTIGARMVIGGRVFNSAACLIEVDETPTLLVPDSPYSVGTHVLNAADGSDSFWSANRVCWMTLAVLGTSSAGDVCEIVQSTCRPSNQLQCPPSCASSTGMVLFIPNGLSTLTGG